MPWRLRVDAVVRMIKNITMLEKNAPTPTSMFLNSSSSLVAPFRNAKCSLAGQLFLFDLLTGLPEEQVGADSGTEDSDQRCPFVSRTRDRWNQRVVKDLPPVGSHQKSRNGICEEYENDPFETYCNLSILEPDRCPRNKKRERHYEPARVHTAKHPAASAMPARSAAMLIVFAIKRATTKVSNSHRGKRFSDSRPEPGP